MVAVVFMGMLERNVNQQSIFDRKSFISGICFGLFKFYLMEKAVLFGHILRRAVFPLKL